MDVGSLYAPRPLSFSILVLGLLAAKNRNVLKDCQAQFCIDLLNTLQSHEVIKCPLSSSQLGIDLNIVFAVIKKHNFTNTQSCPCLTQKNVNFDVFEIF